MIEKVLIISFITIAIWSFYLEGMILGWLGSWLDRSVPNWLKSPIYECSICMAFWYGTPLYWLIYGNSWQEWLIVIFASMGFNAIFVKMKRN